MTKSNSVVDAARLLLTASPSPMMLYTPEQIILFVNSAYEKMTGRVSEDLVGRRMFDAFRPKPGEDEASAETAISAAVAEMISTGKPHIIGEQQHDLPNADGVYEPRHWSIVQWPIHDGDEAVAILQRSEDITETVRQRRLTETVRQAAEEISGLAFFSYNPDDDKFVRTAAIDEMFGFDAGEAGNFAKPFFERVVPEDLPEVLAEVDRAMAGGPGTSAAFDYRVKVPDAKRLRFIRVRAGIERDPADGLLKLFGAFIDMTDLEESRARLEELSRNNAALVEESNHRIKNSLAIASAMLSFQMRAVDDPTVEAALQAAATRIMAISDVHGELFADSGVEWVDAGQLIERFVTSFERTVDTADCKIDLAVDSIRLPSRFAVTMALILNELLTNAVKYGITQEEDCKIEVSLEADDGEIKLRVDNAIAGKRFAEIVSEGVGTELVHAFTQQLEGEIVTAQPDGRFCVCLSFPVPDEDLETRETELKPAR